MARQYSRRMTITFDYLIRIPSPLGRLEVTAHAAGLTSLTIERNGQLPHDEQPELANRVLERAAQQLDEYFSGRRRNFALPYTLVGTEFQRDVWEALAGVRWGDHVSYGELALDAGHAGSARAIGGAVAQNPLPIVIGCHRVLSSRGKIIGYTGGKGVPTKLWLLEHEGITLAA